MAIAPPVTEHLSLLTARSDELSLSLVRQMKEAFARVPADGRPDHLLSWPPSGSSPEGIASLRLLPRSKVCPESDWSELVSYEALEQLAHHYHTQRASDYFDALFTQEAAHLASRYHLLPRVASLFDSTNTRDPLLLYPCQEITPLTHKADFVVEEPRLKLAGVTQSEVILQATAHDMPYVVLVANATLHFPDRAWPQDICLFRMSETEPPRRLLVGPQTYALLEGCHIRGWCLVIGHLSMRLSFGAEAGLVVLHSSAKVALRLTRGFLEYWFEGRELVHRQMPISYCIYGARILYRLAHNLDKDWREPPLLQEDTTDCLLDLISGWSDEMPRFTQLLSVKAEFAFWPVPHFRLRDHRLPVTYDESRQRYTLYDEKEMSLAEFIVQLERQTLLFYYITRTNSRKGAKRLFDLCYT